MHTSPQHIKTNDQSSKKYKAREISPDWIQVVESLNYFEVT